MIKCASIRQNSSEYIIWTFIARGSADKLVHYEFSWLFAPFSFFEILCWLIAVQMFFAATCTRSSYYDWTVANPKYKIED